MVSIIIVHYKVPVQLFACISSIQQSKTMVPYEIIIVDNDEKNTIERSLKKKFPQVQYLKTSTNIGFGAGSNMGAKKASGEYLFFLNPDTIVSPHAIDRLLHYLKKNKHIGIVAPLLLGKDGEPYQQGSLSLTPSRGVIILSFLNRLFPKNPLSRKYFLQDWDQKETKEVSVAPGTAFVIHKDLFIKVGGFDERFFLYFEEFDLCKRVNEVGKKISIYPGAQVTHSWGESTKKRNDIAQIFAKSRFLYFKKHFGLPKAFMVEAFLAINKTTLFLMSILALTIFLSLYRIHELMPFIGDQGWYYLSARDMLFTGEIPLVGIASSHPWLHQGAYWTYLLGLGFVIFGFAPITGIFISVLIHAISLLVLYFLAKIMFSSRTAVISTLLYATSPLVLSFVRMPYHTSPIPLVMIFFLLALFLWIKGKVFAFPVVIFLLAVLYNFELATFPLVFVVLLILGLGLWQHHSWARAVLQLKIIAYACLAFVIGMLPMLLYDFSHGFPQTVLFLAWVGYKVLVVFGYPPVSPAAPVSWNEMFTFVFSAAQRLLFALQGFVAIVLLLGSISYTAYRSFKAVHGRYVDGCSILFFATVLPLISVFIVKTPSGAYLPMLLPGLILLVSVLLSRLYLYRFGRIGVIVIVGAIITGNIFFLFTQMFNPIRYPVTLEKQIRATQYIIKEAKGESYFLRGEGPGSQFESFTMNYRYLAWWLGKASSTQKKKVEFIIRENEDGIQLKKVIYD